MFLSLAYVFPRGLCALDFTPILSTWMLTQIIALSTQKLTPERRRDRAFRRLCRVAALSAAQAEAETWRRAARGRFSEVSPQVDAKAPSTPLFGEGRESLAREPELSGEELRAGRLLRAHRGADNAGCGAIGRSYVGCNVWTAGA